jgi:Tfp pilus assembly protein PilF
VEPDSSAAKLGLAAALRGLGAKHPGNFAAAENLLKEVLAAAPGHWAASYNLAVLYAEYMNKPEAARELYREFLATAPSEHPARATAEKWLGDHPEQKVAAP